MYCNEPGCGIVQRVVLFDYGIFRSSIPKRIPLPPEERRDRQRGRAEMRRHERVTKQMRALAQRYDVPKDVFQRAAGLVRVVDHRFLDVRLHIALIVSGREKNWWLGLAEVARYVGGRRAAIAAGLRVFKTRRCPPEAIVATLAKRFDLGDAVLTAALGFLPLLEGSDVRRAALSIVLSGGDVVKVASVTGIPAPVLQKQAREAVQVPAIRTSASSFISVRGHVKDEEHEI